MHIFITTPSLRNPHGGTRILNEWATRLSKHYQVTLYVNDGGVKCNWYDFPKTVKVTGQKAFIKRADCVIIGSPHSIGLQKYATKKCFIFLQMLEHLFNPTNQKFGSYCEQFYKSPHPMFCLAQWNIDYLQSIGRKGPIIHIGNGTNFDHFPIERVEKKPIVLVEGWESSNSAKDVDSIGPKVAKRLKEDGYKITAYSQLPLKTMASIPDEYYYKPTLGQMNNLYRDAKILLKASKFDARSTAPMEAMTKGTPTARAIISGDDDLTDGFNCLKVGYDEEELYRVATKLLTDQALYNKLSAQCITYVEQHDWDYWMGEIRKCIEG